MAKSNFDEEIKSSIKSPPKSPSPPARPPGNAAPHNPDAIPEPPPSPLAYSDTTSQGGLEVPSPVGTGAPTADGFLPSDPAAMGGDALTSDPVLMDAIAMIIETLMNKSAPQQAGAPLV